ncbi:MAG: sulfite exporter TauE/SafE family protein [Ruminococcaceae bacterium]|nr:sulfite exporter TauE/SafE family protein [Oscillospiraceae bacterium]
MLLLPIVSFFIAILSGLGVGSAGLLVTWLTLIEGMPQITAQGMNLIFFLCSSGVALPVHLFRTPPLWGAVLLLLPTGVLGSLLGGFLAPLLPQAILRRLFGFLLIAAGSLGLLSGKK